MVENSFWSKVKRSNDCWEWQASLRRGYGALKVNGRMEGAHRIAWKLCNGEIPDGMLVLHKCDNPLCVRVSHLYLGTQKENAQDRKIRNRGYRPVGEKNVYAKLTVEQVLKIRDLYKMSILLQREIAKKFNIGQDTVSLIVNRKIWSHI